MTVQKTGTDGNFLTTYAYISVSTQVATPGWYYSDAGTWVSAADVTFTEGEGMIVWNNHSVGANFVISGEVDLQPSLILPKGASFCGNFTPCPMTLGEIQCVQTNGAAWQVSGKSATKCNGDVTVQKTNAEGNFGTTLTAQTFSRKR